MKRLVFLHIPKTAGQSVHNYLVDAFGKDQVFPFRVNSQINDFGLLAEDGYRVYSGHFDWSVMEQLPGEKIYFTVLRNPIDRILSFYFYLRKKALSYDEISLSEKNKRGLLILKESSPDGYFCNEDAGFRRFVDDHYDNFYTRFFSSKRFTNNSFSDPVDAIKDAVSNINSIHGLYTMDNWSEVSGLIERNFEDVDASLSGFSYSVNVGDGKSTEERLQALREIGPSEQAISRIREMVRYDEVIYNYISSLNAIR